MSDADQVADALDGEGDTALVVADAEDYNQSRRLKAIHAARDDVRKAYREKERYTSDSTHTEENIEIARRVAFYGAELEPLMDEAGWEKELPEKFPWDNVRHYIQALGKAGGFEKGTPPTFSMSVFRQLNEFIRSVGLGVDFEDGDDEWEV